jgi:hypothetical protein
MQSLLVAVGLVVLAQQVTVAAVAVGLVVTLLVGLIFQIL